MNFSKYPHTRVYEVVKTVIGSRKWNTKSFFFTFLIKTLLPCLHFCYSYVLLS